MYQQGTRFTMPISISGISLELCESIEFIFKQTSNKNAMAKKTALWKSDGSGSATQQGDLILIPWTLAETYKFKQGEMLYIHARIHLKSTEDNPPVPIVAIKMEPTLFENGEVVLQ